MLQLLQTASEHLATSARRIMVTGAVGSGKTTFSVSCSRFAGDTISGPHRLCEDVCVLSGDAEGILGAIDAGLEPGHVVDMTGCLFWDEYPTTWTRPKEPVEHLYKHRLAASLHTLMPLIEEKQIRILVVDLARPASLILKKVAPSDISDWAVVGNLGDMLYDSFFALRGVTIIGNCQIKGGIPVVESPAAAMGAEARAVGGSRTRYAADLAAGVVRPWVSNSSFMFSRKVANVAGDKDTPPMRVYTTHSVSNGVYPAKSRAHTKIKSIEPGERSLNSLMRDVYGASL